MGTSGWEIPFESILSHTQKLQQLFWETLGATIAPYFENLDWFNHGILQGIAILTEKLQSLNLAQEEQKQIALAMTLSDLGKGRQIVEGDNLPSAERYFIHELYAFREILSQEEKKTLTLESFFTEKLLPFVGRENTQLLEQGYRAFLDSGRLKNYCASHDISINTISMSQAWSIFHVLMGEEVWDKIEGKLEEDSPEKREFQSARKLAKLHHAMEGVYQEEVNELSPAEVKQLWIIVLIDKIESYRGRMKSNIVPLRGMDIQEGLRAQWELDEQGHYVANTDLKHINDLITLFQTSQFPENVKKIFSSLLWEIHPHLLRRTKVLSVEQLASLVEKTVEEIHWMSPEALVQLIKTTSLQAAIRTLFETGSLKNFSQVNAWQRKGDLEQQAA